MSSIKKMLLLLISTLISNSLFAAQTNKASLKDTVLIADYVERARDFYDNFETDSSSYYAIKALSLSKQLFYNEALQTNEKDFYSVKALIVDSYITYSLSIAETDKYASKDTLVVALDLLSDEDQLEKGLIYRELGYSYAEIGQMDDYLTYSLKALAAFKAVNNQYNEAIQLRILGSLYSEIGKYGVALEYYIESLKMGRELEDNSLIVESLLGMGIVYANIENWQEAIDVQMQALEIFQLTNEAQDIARIYNDMGVTYSTSGLKDSALVQHNKALELRLETTDSFGIFNSYAYIADLLADKGDITKAIEYYDLALNYTDDFNYQTVINDAYLIQGELLLKASEVEKAKQNFEYVLVKSETVNDINAQSRAYVNLATIAEAQGNYNKAKDLLKRAEQIVPEAYLQYQSELFLDISKLYFKLGDYKKAYSNNIIYSAIKDSLVEDENRSQIAKMTNVLEFENQLALKRESNEKMLAIKQAEIDRSNFTRNIFLVGMIFAVILVAIILIRFIEKKKLNDKLNETLNNLKATQKQLIQSEKMASLGELTAGIAHEIQNPLNFVNNFAEVSNEMVDEINEELAEGNLEEVKELLSDIRQNLGKINHHGKRADSIIKGMLQHSRGSSGKMEPTELNNFVREYVNLSYHGMRAGKKPINVEIAYDFDKQINTFPLISEDFSRVLVNLCNNAFDAMWEKGEIGNGKREIGKEKYIPRLSVRTRKNAESIFIEVEDNGTGIPDEIKDKILQPFFTTKKGTEGTGLGLSITNDIIKAHSGQLQITSSPGNGSTFIIQLASKA